MTISEVTVSRAVKRYMAENDLTQEVLAKRIGLKQTTLGRRLRNKSKWSLDDLDALAALGVPVRVPFEVVAGDRA